MIVAHGKNFEIGLDNKLLWHLKDDLKIFKETTMGQMLIMGRKTFESIGRPLPGRRTVVISRKGKIEAKSTEGVVVKKSLEEALDYAKAEGLQEVFLAGGGEIYRQGFSQIDKLYASVVDYHGAYDTTFPNYQLTDFDIEEELKFPKSERNQLSFSFYKLNKKTPTNN